MRNTHATVTGASRIGNGSSFSRSNAAMSTTGWQMAIMKKAKVDQRINIDACASLQSLSRDSH